MRTYFFKTFISITFCLMLSFSNLLFAQSFNGGFVGGLSASEVSGDNLSGPNKLGFNAGIYTQFDFDDYKAVELGLMYVQKGSKRNPTLTSSFEYRFHLEYVEIPLLYNFAIRKFEKIQYIGKINYQVGLSYARLMRYKEKENGRLVLPGEKEDYYFNESNFIIGFTYPISEKLDFNFKSSSSLTPIRPHKGKGTVWYNWGQYHTLWMLDLSYKIK